MLLVHVLVRVPLAGEEGVLVADQLPVEEGDHLRVLVRQVLDLEVAAEVGVLLVHVLQHKLVCPVLGGADLTCSITSTSYWLPLDFW